MPGRTPAEAFREFVEPLQRALACVAKCKLTPSPGGMASPDGDHQLLGNGGEVIPVGGVNNLGLGLRMRYRFVEDDEIENGPWKVRTLAYSYTVSNDSGSRVISWHWHPGGTSHAAAPHAHLGSAQLMPDAVLTSKQHLPTSRVALEQVISALIAEYGVPHRIEDWDQRLALSQGIFELHRTWG